MFEGVLGARRGREKNLSNSPDHPRTEQTSVWPAELVRVYEKVRSGVWVDNGAFQIVDAWQVSDGTRIVCKHRLKAFDREVEEIGSADHEPERTRVIPSDAEQSFGNATAVDALNADLLRTSTLTTSSPTRVEAPHLDPRTSNCSAPSASLVSTTESSRPADGSPNGLFGRPVLTGPPNTGIICGPRGSRVICGRGVSKLSSRVISKRSHRLDNGVE